MRELKKAIKILIIIFCLVGLVFLWSTSRDNTVRIVSDIEIVKMRY